MVCGELIVSKSTTIPGYLLSLSGTAMARNTKNSGFGIATQLAIAGLGCGIAPMDHDTRRRGAACMGRAVPEKDLDFPEFGLVQFLSFSNHSHQWR